MTPEDLPAYLELVAQTQGLTLFLWEDNDVLRRVLARNPGLSMVATDDDDKIVGGMLAAEGLMLKFHHLAVSKDWRGCGIGRQIVGASIRALRAQSVHSGRVEVTVLDSNVGALRFWEKCGFVRRTKEAEIHFLTLNVNDWL